MKLDEMKKLYKSGDYTLLKNIKHLTNGWEHDNIHPFIAINGRDITADNYKLIHKKHSAILNHVLGSGTVNYMKRPSMYNHKLKESEQDFFECYESDNEYDIVFKDCSLENTYCIADKDTFEALKSRGYKTHTSEEEYLSYKFLQVGGVESCEGDIIGSPRSDKDGKTLIHYIKEHDYFTDKEPKEEPKPNFKDQLNYTKPVCKGSWNLGTACGHCERCLANKPDTLSIEHEGEYNMIEPKHYTDLAISPLEYIEANKHLTWSLSNSIKYISRAGLKPSNSRLQDLNKALLYLQHEIELEKDSLHVEQKGE